MGKLRFKPGAATSLLCTLIYAGLGMVARVVEQRVWIPLSPVQILLIGPFFYKSREMEQKWTVSGIHTNLVLRITEVHFAKNILSNVLQT